MSDQTTSLQLLTNKLDARGIDLDRVTASLRSQIIETPSWGYADSGTRFGVFEAGMASARDPKYTVVPQRERLQRGEPVRYHG